jgi:hypothetical protein
MLKDVRYSRVSVFILFPVQYKIISTSTDEKNTKI